MPRSTFAGLARNRQDLDTTDTFAELEHRLDGGGLVKLAARQMQRDSFYSAARANSALAANGDYQVQTVDFLQDSTDRNYDFYLATPVQWLGRTHRVLLGASHSRNRSLGGNYVYGPNATANLLRPDHALPYPALQLPGYDSETLRTENALYGQAQLGLTERARLLLGGRLSWAQVESRRLSDGKATSSANPGRQFIPSVAALYDLDAQTTAYASYAETMVVQSALTSAGSLLPPRTGSQVELGVKGEFLNKRLQAHAALFRILDSDRAIADPAAATASIPGGKVRSQGLELEASGQVAPGWDLMAGYAYTDTKYLRAPAAQQGQAFSPVTPRHSLNLSTRYALRNPGLRGWSVGGGVSYRSAFHAQSGALRIASGGYALFNAQVAYQINDRVSVSLAVENLFDKTYYEKVSGVARQNFYGAPRSVVLALRAHTF